MPLKNAASLNSAIIDMANAIILTLDTKGFIQLFSKGGEKITGFAQEEVLNRFCLDVLVPKTVFPEVHQQLSRLIENGLPPNFENSIFTKDGLEKVISWQNNAMLENGEVIGTVCVGIDITERKRAEKEVQLSEETFRQIAEMIPAPVRFSDENGKVIFINRSFTKVLGYTIEDIPTTHEWFYKAYPNKTYRQEVLLKWRTALDNIHRGITNNSGPVEITCKDGISKHFEIITALNNDNVYALLIDITERKKAEDVLKASEKRFREIAENLPFAMSSLFSSGNRNINFINKKFTEVLGYTLEDLPNAEAWLTKSKQTPSLSQLLQETNDPTIAAFFRKEISVIPDFPSTIICKDGTAKQFMLTYTNIGDIMYVTFIDVTEKLRNEQELLESHRQLRELASYLQTVREQERTGIAREIHDELGQVITGIKIEMSWLRKHLPEDGKQLKEKVSETIALLDNAVKVVRKISSDLRPSILDDIGLAAALEWQGNDFSQKTRTAFWFSNGIDGMNPSINIATGLFRIFQESLTNIMRHAEATKVEASLLLENNQLTLCIKDNGKGFNAEKQKGTLGLLGMKERAIMMDGILDINSHEGNGTTITVKVPFIC